MTLIDHARHELELINAEPETIDGYLKVLECIAETKHDTDINMHILSDLVWNIPLSPLTNDPDEWMYVADKIWQNRRNSEAFSYNGGRTYHLLSEKKNGKAPIYKSEKKGK